jgi:hypothetical protein
MNLLSRYGLRGLFTVLLGLLSISAAHAQILVLNLGNALTPTGTIGEYTTSGATVNASLISGLTSPYGIAVSGANLFVAQNGTGASNWHDW